MKPVTFYYNAEMLPFFEEGRKEFCQRTMIALTGINWEVKGNQLLVTITEEQQERWLFHLAFNIGKAYGMAESIPAK